MISAPADPKATKGYLRGSSLLLAGRFISLATNFGVQVLSVRYLSKAQYGALAFALATVTTGTSVSLLGLPRAVNRFVPIFHEEGDYRSMFGTIFMAMSTVLGFGLAIAALVFGFHGFLGGSTGRDPLSVGVLLALIGLIPIQALDNLFQGLAAIFIGARSLFYRRHLLGPGLKLGAVLLVIALQKDVYLLAACYLAAGAIGLANYLVLLHRALRKQGLLTRSNLQGLKVPVRKIFGVSIPLLSTDLLLLLTLDFALAVMVLDHFRGPEEVAGLRAVASVAGLCVVVFDSLKFLFTPTASRLYARKATAEINDLYRQSSIWVTVLTFPVFAVCCFLSEPVTLLLFGEKYRGAGVLLAWLAAGYYFNSALGMTVYLLQVYARIRYIVWVNVVTAIFGAIATLWFVPRWGAVGAAAATTGTLCFYTIANYAGVLRGTGVGRWKPRYLKVYVTVLAAVCGLALLQFLYPPVSLATIALTAIAIAGASLALVRINNRVMELQETFPFLKRLPGIRLILGRSSKKPVQEPAPEIRTHLEGHAPEYFPDLTGDGDLKVELTRSMIRRFNWLYEFDLRTKGRSHRVMVKVPLPVTAPLFRLEHAALSAIQEHFGSMGDDRFAP